MTNNFTRIAASAVLLLAAVSLVAAYALRVEAAPGGLLVENYWPYAQYNDGIKSENGIVLSGDDGDITTGDDLTVADDASVSGDLSVSGVSSHTGTTTVGVLDASEFTQGGGIATLTDADGGAYTLTQEELLNNNVLSFAAGGAGQEVIQLTFPATSSLSQVIPNAGDMRSWLFDASALAAATTTTMTAGTGMDLIAVTANDDVIDGAEWAEITCWRQADTDFTCLVSELLHAD